MLKLNSDAGGELLETLEILRAELRALTSGACTR